MVPHRKCLPLLDQLDPTFPVLVSAHQAMRKYSTSVLLRVVKGGDVKCTWSEGVGASWLCDLLLCSTYTCVEVKSRSVSKMTSSLLPCLEIDDLVTLAGTYNWFAPEDAAEESRGEGKRRGEKEEECGG